MNRLTALDLARLAFGPTGYAEYIWIGGGEPPRCQVGKLQGGRFFPLPHGNHLPTTFEEAFAYNGVRVPTTPA